MTSYWSAWRAAHPEYRERERARMSNRTAKSHGDRAGQRIRRAARRAMASGDNGHTLTDHALLVRARAIAARFRRPDRRSLLYRPVHEEAVAAAALALVAGEDAEAAAQRVVREDVQWQHRTLPIEAVQW